MFLTFATLKTKEIFYRKIATIIVNNFGFLIFKITFTERFYCEILLFSIFNSPFNLFNKISIN